MALLASQQDFEEGGLYGRPDGSGSYQEYYFFQERLNALKGRWAPKGQTIAIWGCGWGYLVQYCLDAGYDPWGFDASQYAIDKGKQMLPAIADRLFVRDMLDAADVDASRGDAGLPGNKGFDILITEDVLSCLTDLEITTTLPLIRGSVKGSNPLHIISPSDDVHDPDPRLNWKTKAEWLALLSPPDVCVGPYGEPF